MALICREVVPIDGRKSFYGKALEYSDSEGNVWLKSYNTIVAKIDSSGNLYVRGEYSLTTNRHVYSFAAAHGLPLGNIKDMRKIIEKSQDESFDMLSVMVKEYRKDYGID